MNTMKPLTPARDQRGLASLLVTTLLCLATILIVAYASRNVAVEARASANHVRATQAREAAEAGAEWATARLNDAARIGPDCLSSRDGGARSARDLWLAFQGNEGTVVPTRWSDAGTLVPLRSACVRRGTGWACSCPSSGATVVPSPEGTATAPAFVVELAAAPAPGFVRIVSTGCTRSDAACLAGADASHEATARVEVTVALSAALRSAPAAALSARGDIDTGDAALGAHHRDATSGSLALHAGGAISGSALRLTVAAGSDQGGALAASDATLAGLDADRFFARYFGMSRGAWAAQPAVTRVACTGDCTPAIADAIAAGERLIHVAGDVALVGPAVFGSADDPVVIVAGGAIALSGAMTIHGVVHGDALRWDDADAPGALIRGATLVGGHYAGNAAPDFVHDAAVLARLRTRAGSFVRINGSWKDF
ncbi:MAG: hypothetical protein ABIO71_00515 [Caldimonas sp.]